MKNGKKPNGAKLVADSPEPELDAGILRLFGTRTGEYPEPERTALRETCRLAVLYPGRYVVYRDHRTGPNGDGLLRWREVLFVTDDKQEFDAHVWTKLTDDERRVYGMVRVPTADEDEALPSMRIPASARSPVKKRTPRKPA